MGCCTCSHEGCSIKSSFGVKASRKTHFCLKHTMNGIVNVVNRKCSQEECSKQPSFGVEGTGKAMSCKQHAMHGILNCNEQEVPLLGMLEDTVV